MTDRSAPIVLLGGGGHAAVVAESARSAGWSIVGFLDDDDRTAEATANVGLEFLGRTCDLSSVIQSLPDGVAVHAAVGDSDLRKRWLEQASSLPIVTIIDATAVVSPSATIGGGVFIAPLAVVNARANIGEGVIINTSAVIEHDCVVEPFCHVAPGAILAGAASVGGSSLIGAGAVVCPGVRVGEAAVLGAGAVATRDVPDGCCAVGVPARADAGVSR